jgi:hypothetical protein
LKEVKFKNEIVVKQRHMTYDTALVPIEHRRLVYSNKSGLVSSQFLFISYFCAIGHLRLFCQFMGDFYLQNFLVSNGDV